MTQAPVRLSFEEYLSLDVETIQGLMPEGRHEFIDGEFIQVAPEAGRNARIANRLFFYLIQSGVPMDLISPGQCELQLPPLPSPKAPLNRYPDLVVVREEHIQQTEDRLTVYLDMEPPRIVVEVVSKGKRNRKRDYEDKLTQYALRGIPEYWIADPQTGYLYVLTLVEGEYKAQSFTGSDRIVSADLPGLKLTAQQVLRA